IASDIHKKYNGEYEKIYSDVVCFIEELTRKRLLAPLIDQDKSSSQTVCTYPLRGLWLNVTNNCNLRCIHCHKSAGASIGEELSTSDICNLVNEFSDGGGELLTISGGEPFLRDDILDILNYVKNSKVIHTIVITNGTLLNDDIYKFLENFGDKISVQVSLDGATAAVNDKIRGKGTFEKAIGCIKELRKRNVHVVMRMTVMKANNHEIDDYLKLSNELGCVADFGIIQEKGRATGNCDVLLNEEEMVMTLKKIYLVDRKISCVSHVENPHQGNSKPLMEHDNAPISCGVGSFSLSVSPAGDVYPCDALECDDMKIGNIHISSISELWKNSPLLKKLREREIKNVEPCNVCEFIYFCRGGCLGDTYMCYHSIDTRHPCCNIRKIYYEWFFYDHLPETLRKKR
ncbi:MAG: hypothetical protein CVU88_08340, partial [Firmicutes bacterium HGW-Firmicutes-13]